MSTNDDAAGRLRRLALAPPPDDAPADDPEFTAAVLGRLPRRRPRASPLGWWIAAAVPASIALAVLILGADGPSPDDAAPVTIPEVAMATLILSGAAWLTVRPAPANRDSA